MPSVIGRPANEAKIKKQSRLANFDNGVFERLLRYEATLWRQGDQTLLAIEALRPRNHADRIRP
jgi:hypothetical protein